MEHGPLFSDEIPTVVNCVPAGGPAIMVACHESRGGSGVSGPGVRTLGAWQPNSRAKHTSV